MAWLKLPVNKTGMKSICCKADGTFFEMVTEHRTPDISGIFKTMTLDLCIHKNLIIVCQFKENYHSPMKFIYFE